VTQLVGMESPRVELSGPSLMVTPAAAQNIGLAVHELAANAAQHGRLMAPDSHVSFAWQIEERLPAQGWLHVTWREWSGSPVQPPGRKGFGHLVLERLAPEGLGGTARLSFEGDGVIWHWGAVIECILRREVITFIGGVAARRESASAARTSCDDPGYLDRRRRGGR
jgi:two-component sensor histidine kinase